MNFEIISRYRRQTSTIYLRVEIRNDPPNQLSANNSAASTAIRNANAYIINRYQSGDLQATWAASSTTGNNAPLSLSVQEPGNQTTIALGVISRLVLETPPSSCRQQSACDIQPVLVAYDSTGNRIDKLGSNDQPWQITATVISPSGVGVIGGIANYVNGQSQYSSFGVTTTGSVQVQFSLISPYGVAA